jgi:PilZ domain-containing protein
MQTDYSDRRRGNRWIPVSGDPVSRVRLRLGRELTVINVSTSGALVHGTTRLLPGTHVDVHVTASQGRVLIRARVIRCAVWEVTADAVQYRGALAFNTPVELQPMDAALMPVLTDPPADASPLLLPEPV